MQFGRWYPLARAVDHAPVGPGVLQIRTRVGLVDYPRGKSAMVHYQAADDVCATARAIAIAHPEADWLCRHLEDAPADPETIARKLIRDFTVRFGSPPTVPA